MIKFKIKDKFDFCYLTNIQEKNKNNYFYTKDNFNKELLKYIKNEFKN